MLRQNSVEFFTCSHYIQRKIIKGKILVHYDGETRLLKADTIRNNLKEQQPQKQQTQKQCPSKRGTVPKPAQTRLLSIMNKVALCVARRIKHITGRPLKDRCLVESAGV